MQTYLFEFSRTQADAVRAALDHEANATLDRMRQSIASDFLTADELQAQIRTELSSVRPALAALTHVDGYLADILMGELAQVMTGYRATLRALRQAESQMLAWNTRAEEEKNRHSTAAVTA